MPQFHHNDNVVYYLKLEQQLIIVVIHVYKDKSSAFIRDLISGGKIGTLEGFWVIELKFAILDSQSINFVLTGFFGGCMQY